MIDRDNFITALLVIIGVLLASTVVASSIAFIQVYEQGEMDLSLSDDTYNTETDTTDSGDALDSTVIVYSEGEQDSSIGSGFVYNENYIVTNAHVVANGDEFSVEYIDGNFTEAELVGSDMNTDVAVLEVDRKPDYAEPLRVTDELPERQSHVRTIGHPRGLEYTETTGIVSNIGRSFTVRGQFSIPDMIQTDAALDQGNSGGPLIAGNNTIVGMNTATRGENLGLAVSGRMINTIASSLIDNGDHQHPLIGIQTVEMSPLVDNSSDVDVTNGLIVRDVAEESDASQSIIANESITETDIILRVNGRNLTDNEDLASYLLLNKQPNDTIELKLYNGGDIRTEEVELGERP